MKNRLKVTGVYDRKTLKMMNALGIDRVGFDFRPKSFNFLQQYIFLELLEEHYNPLGHYYLQFQDETDFVIKKMVDDLFEQINRTDSNVVLEFSDFKSAAFYDQFELPFCWHFQDFETLAEVGKAKNLVEVSLNYFLLEELKNNDALTEFAVTLNEIVQRKKVDLILDLDWDSDLFPSLAEFFDFSAYSFAINQKTEISYRNVDMIAVKKHLSHYR